MPAWYVHIEAAATTMERLKNGVPAGSPLTQAEAIDLFTVAHDNRNYFAAGALGPDLFFLLPDFKGDTGKGLLALVEFVLTTWKALDDNFITQWEQWMTPVLDDKSQLANGITGGMLGEVSQVLGLLSASLDDFVLGIAGQMVDVFGLLSSGTQMGYDDSTFFWSDMFHYRKTYQFARQLYANALKADVDIKNGGTSEVQKPATEPSRVPKQQAFALGWMNHCATDVAAHPFTNAKCGGPYRTHWQRHHVIENHMDAFVYGLAHKMPMTNYNSLDTAAMQFRLAFLPGVPPGAPPDPAMPDDVAGPDYFPSTFKFPGYPETEHAGDARTRHDVFDVDSEPLPEHICELLLKTMQDVYTGPDDMGGPQVLRWDAGKHIDDGGRPTIAVLQDMFQIAFDYSKFSSSSGLGVRQPMPPDVFTDHNLPQPPGLPIDGNADPSMARPLTILDILLAIIAFAIWIAEFLVWLATVGAALLADLATWPLRELLFQLLVVPAWDLYMLCRKPLILEGYLAPRPSEISNGLVVLGADEQGALIQLRADLDAPSGFGSMVGMTEPSGLDATPGAATQGFSLDPAYPRAMLTDLDPPWYDKAPIDGGTTASEFVAPWRYPSHNMAGMRNGWEAPRTHVGPYVQGQDAGILMDGWHGTDAARHLFEGARSPEDTEAVAAELLATTGQHLGDPVDYGAYLVGQLTGNWQSATGYVAHDWQHPLPDFNLDADRGYAYQCWDYLRHAPSDPKSPVLDLDVTRPDQWQCAPQIFGLLSQVLGADPKVLAAQVLSWYGYQEPYTVPQKYDSRDNPHHRSRYDPLKRLAHHYRPRVDQQPPPPPPDWDGSDLQVTDAEMRAVGMSPTGRRLAP